MFCSFVDLICDPIKHLSLLFFKVKNPYQFPSCRLFHSSDLPCNYSQYFSISSNFCCDSMTRACAIKNSYKDIEVVFFVLYPFSNYSSIFYLSSGYTIVFQRNTYSNSKISFLSIND